MELALPSFAYLPMLKLGRSGSPNDGPFFRNNNDAVVIDSLTHGVKINFDAKQIRQSKYAHILFGNRQEAGTLLRAGISKVEDGRRLWVVG
jgi:hypothetical protein